MQIQINTNNNIQGPQELNEHFQNVLENKLRKFKERITRIEVHLGDENGPKGGNEDKRCMIEARLEGMKPMAVTHQAESLDLALSGAVSKLTNLLDSTLKR